MFFVLSKCLAPFLVPLNAVALLVATGMFFATFGGQFRRAGQRLLSLSAALFLILGTVPVGHNLLVFLETRFPRPQTLPEPIDGIIVLGGPMDTARSSVYSYPVLNERAERLTDFLSLSVRYPDAKQVISGGPGRFSPSDRTEADIARQLFGEMGFDTEKMLFEDRSRNTYQNVALSKALAKPSEGEHWVLITSAFHMLRSVAIFQAQGWDVIPYPTDHITNGQYSWLPGLSFPENYEKLATALHEIAGLVAYRATGRIQAFLPEPARHSPPAHAQRPRKVDE